jgi:hypothetical protein
MLATVSGTLIDEGVSAGCNEDPVIATLKDVGLSRLTN